MNENIINYIESVNTIYQTGETTEHSFRGSLEVLVKSMLPKAKKNDTPINVINEPKRKEYGAPDFELRKGEVIISFIETKDLFDKDLDVTPKSWTVYLICFDVVSCIVQDSCRA